MSASLSAVTITRLEKAGLDNGFDQELPRQREWLAFASTQAPLRAWLAARPDGRFLVALSLANVARALDDYGTPVIVALPSGAAAAREVADIPAVHRLLRRAFQLSKALPDELLHTFEKDTATLPRTTEAERLVVQRVGQDLFRAALLDYWEGRCPITGLAIADLLRASHIKPWAHCATDAERLDVFNGLLLAPHLDAAFDRGFLTIGDDGEVLVSPLLPAPDQKILGLEAALRLNDLADGHRRYLVWHRERIFMRS